MTSDTIGTMPVISWLTTIGCWLRRRPSRPRKVLGLALLGVCAAGSHGGTQTRAAPEPMRLEADADEIDYGSSESDASLLGHVKLHGTHLPGTMPELTVEADHLRLNLDTGDAEIGPATTLVSPKIRLSTENLRYNFRTQALAAGQTRVVIPLRMGAPGAAIYARSREVSGEHGNITLEHASVTTCNREHPHWAFVMRRGQVRTGTDQVYVYNASVKLWGVQLPLAPRFSMDVGPHGSSSSAINFPGYSAVDGFYVPWVKSFSGVNDPVQTRLELRGNTSFGLSGTFAGEYARPGYRFWGALTRHAEIEDDVRRKLVHDAWPEVGWERVRRAGSATVSAMLVAGNYRDEILRSGHTARTTAVTARLDWNLRRVSKGERFSWWAGAGMRASAYGNGDSYRTIDLRAGAAAPLWTHARFEIELRHHFVSGRSPFEFDDVDLASEAHAVFATPITRNWSIEAGGRYDLQATELRDYTLGVSRRMHCVIWHLNYQFVNTRFGFSAELADLALPQTLTITRPRERPRPAIPIMSPALMQPERAARAPTGRTELSPAQSDLPNPLALAESGRPRAPDGADPLRRRPPPSLRLAYRPDLQ